MINATQDDYNTWYNRVPYFDWSDIYYRDRYWETMKKVLGVEFRI